jgi:hypothetical protein
MKKLEIYQNKKTRVESAFERIEKVQRVAFSKLGVNLSKGQAAKIAVNSLIMEAKKIESVSAKWKQHRQDVALNEANRLYMMADAISRNYQV